jgi:hypothetical protein
VVENLDLQELTGTNQITGMNKGNKVCRDENFIQEEIQRAKQTTDIPDSESFGNPVEHVKHSLPTGPAKIPDERKVQELERENLDLKITNRAKEIVIEQMQKERDGFIERLLVSSRTVG